MAKPKFPPPITAIRTGYGGGALLAFIRSVVDDDVDLAAPADWLIRCPAECVLQEEVKTDRFAAAGGTPKEKASVVEE